MSRLGRSQPIQPFSTHGFVDTSPAPPDTPARPTVVENAYRRTLPLPALAINGLYAVTTAPVVGPPPPNVIPVDDRVRRILAPQPISISGIRGFTPPPPFLQPLPTQLVVISDERGRRIYPQPVVLHGPAFPVEVIAALPPPVDTGGPMGAGPTIRGMRDIQEWRERLDDDELAIFLTIYLAT